MNRTHSGPMLTVAGFLWLFAVLAVLVEDSLTDLWAAAALVGLSLMMLGRVR